jgi:hypothetical protein
MKNALLGILALSLIASCSGGKSADSLTSAKATQSKATLSTSPSVTPTPTPTVWSLKEACAYLKRAEARDDVAITTYNKTMEGTSWRQPVKAAPAVVKVKREAAAMLAKPPFPWPAALAEDVKKRRTGMQLLARWAQNIADAKSLSAYNQFANEPYMSQARMDDYSIAAENTGATCA